MTPRELLLATLTLCWLGCAADPAPAPERAADKAPQAETLRPAPLKTHPEEGPRPAWKRAPASALSTDRGAQTEAHELTRTNADDLRTLEEAERTMRARESARERAAAAEGQRRSRALERALRASPAESAAEPEAEERVAAYLELAERRAPEADGYGVAREADAVAAITRRRADVAQELAHEARREADFARRLACATLEASLAAGQATKEAHQAESRAREAESVAAALEREAGYAAEAARRARSRAEVYSGK